MQCFVQALVLWLVMDWLASMRWRWHNHSKTSCARKKLFTLFVIRVMKVDRHAVPPVNGAFNKSSWFF